MQLKKGNTVIYVTIEQFMNDFTFSIKIKIWNILEINIESVTFY